MDMDQPIGGLFVLAGIVWGVYEFARIYIGFARQEVLEQAKEQKR